MRHLVALDELAAMGVSFVSLNEGVDLMTRAGRLLLHILASLAEFERGLSRAFEPALRGCAPKVSASA